MIRLLVIFLLLVLFLCLFFLPRLRKTLWAILGVVTCAIAVMIWLDNLERERSHLRIPLDRVELSNMVASPGLNARSYVVKGRIRNHSADFTLTTAWIQLTHEDCDAHACEIIGQEKSRVLVNVPPRQARDFRVTVPFPSVATLKGKEQWSFGILEVEAE